ncbi:hypothetical protein [Actinoplanes sp. NPDC051411]|uniref:hypothetical protein n=1 Tax=Actinoplanes sp. NPDC051411 TaxID=3155522 RepID=UPI003414B27F
MDRPSRYTTRILEDLTFVLMGYWFYIPHEWLAESPADNHQRVTDQADDVHDRTGGSHSTEEVG